MEYLTLTEAADPYLVERKAEILAAARVVFVRRGFERATMQEIADEVGLSAGALYRYFPGKEALITSVCAAAGAGHLSAFNIDGDDRSALEVLIEGGTTVWGALFGPEGDDALLLNLEATVAAIRQPEQIGEHLAREMAGEVGHLSQVIQQAQTEGSLPSDFEARTLAATLLAVTQGMHLLRGQLGGEVDVDAAWRLLVRMIQQLGRSDLDESQG